MLLLVLRLVAVRTFVIASGSMEGTLLPGDVVLADHARVGGRLPRTDLRLPGYGAPRRGEVWVFTSERAAGGKQVKRLIGLPGDTLTMRDGAVWVNGEMLDQPYARSMSGWDSPHASFTWQQAHLQAGTDPTLYTPTGNDWGPLVIPRASYFALGDNRDRSWDSRHYGLVEHDRLEGRVTFVLFSYGTMPAATALPRPRGVRWSRIGRLVH